jgi:hypothetical protein
VADDSDRGDQRTGPYIHDNLPNRTAEVQGISYGMVGRLDQLTAMPGAHRRRRIDWLAQTAIRSCDATMSTPDSADETD